MSKPKSSKADLYARVLFGLVVVGGLLLLSTYSFGFAMMTLPLLLSGIFLVLLVVGPVWLILRGLRSGKKKGQPKEKGKPVHFNDGERTILYRSDEEKD